MKESSPLRGLRLLPLAAFAMAVAAIAAEENDTPRPAESPAAAGAKPAAKPRLSIDEAYVRERLAGGLRPTSIRFLADGRVKLSFNLLEKNPEHARVFSPPVSQDPRSSFRWTIRREESFAKLEGGALERKRGGIRIAESGSAVLDCWFLDDVEVMVDYVNSVSFDPRQVVAVVFQTDSGKALGSNFGTQCATYVNGVPRGESRGKPVPMKAGHHVKFRLFVKEGKCEARLEKEIEQSMPYDRAEFVSGRVGLLWSHGIAGIVKKIEVTGRLDAKRMAKALRRAGER